MAADYERVHRQFCGFIRSMATDELHRTIEREDSGWESAKLSIDEQRDVVNVAPKLGHSPGTQFRLYWECALVDMACRGNESGLRRHIQAVRSQKLPATPKKTKKRPSQGAAHRVRSRPEDPEEVPDFSSDPPFTDVRQLLNYQRVRPGQDAAVARYSSLLHYAVMAGSQSCVQVLLEEGADVDVSTEHRIAERKDYDGEGTAKWTRCGRNITPLWLATALGCTSIMKLLLNAGADIVDYKFEVIENVPGRCGRRSISQSAWQLAVCDRDAMVVLNHSGRNAVPLAQALAAFVAAPPCSAFRAFCVAPGMVRWPDAVRHYRTVFRMSAAHMDAWDEFQHVPCATLAERACKVGVLQTFLLAFISSAAGLFPGVDAARYVTTLLSGGASAGGWTRDQFSLIFGVLKTADGERGAAPDAFLRLPSDGQYLYEAFKPLVESRLFRSLPSFVCLQCYRQYAGRNADRRVPGRRNDSQKGMLPAALLLPVVVRFSAAGGDLSDTTSLELLRRGKASWLTSLAQIPFVSGELHDGPTCQRVAGQLLPCQSRVSLEMCTVAGGGVPSLECLTRQAVRDILAQSDEDIIAAAQQLSGVTEKCKFLIIS